MSADRAIPHSRTGTVRLPPPSAPRESDRRVRRTRGLLHRALRELILEKGYDRITVQDILDRADVGRSTFYAHFQGKDDLLLNGWPEAVAAISRTESGTGAGDRILAFLRHIEENRQLFRAMVRGSRGSRLLHTTMREAMAVVVEEDLRSRMPADRPAGGDAERRLALAVEFTLGALMNLVIWWADTAAAYSARQLHAEFQALVRQGTDRFTGAVAPGRSGP
jgi:AcrR family transcriptional regulator